MLATLFQTQEISVTPGTEPAAIVVLVVLAVGLIGLYIVISRTRKRSYRAYMARSARESALRENDPDLKKTDEE